MLCVSDTGQGMTAETQAHIFEPFFTTKDVGKGTGLGLAMVYGTVKQSGGFIFVDSAPGSGSTFRLLFPPAGMRAAAAAPAVPRVAGRQPMVLVVEDEVSVRALVSSTLSRDGYTVLPTASADEALDLVTDAGAIDLLLTDASMPGTSGLALARVMLAARPSLPVIVMSGYSDQMLDVSALPQSVTIMRKPFTPTELRQRIRQALNRRAART
jgi:CheY-like chemotaxis protein